MRLRLVLFLLPLSCLLSTTAFAQYRPQPEVAPGEDYRVELGAMFWSPTPELAINTDALDVVGVGEVDFVQEFGIEDKRFTEFRATVKAGRTHKLRFHYLPIRYDPEQVILQRTFVFSGREFTIGLPADAEVEWKLWRFGYEWDFYTHTAGFLGLVAELKYNDVRGEIASPATGLQFVEEQAPIPAFGIIGRGYLVKYVSVTAEFAGSWILDAISEDFDAEFWDLDIYSTVSIGRNVGIQGGYRKLDAEYITDADLGRLKMNGWYLGGLLRF